MHPFERWPPSHRGRWLLALVVAYVVVQVAIALVSAPLSTPSAPNGIVSFELAGSATKAEHIVAGWQRAGVIDEAGVSLGLDFLYMSLYGSVLAALSIAVSRRRPGLARLGRAAAWVSFVAVAFDVVETVSLTRVLDDPSAGGLASLARVCAIAKFALLVVAIVYVLGAGLAGLVQRSPQEA